jgi:hypothetical protein
MSSPSPKVRATMPFAPSAPTMYAASTREPPTLAVIEPESLTISSTTAPSRKSAPA